MGFIAVVIDWYLLIFGIRPVIGLLDSNIAGHGRPVPTGMDLISKKDRFTSVLVSKYFL